MGFKQHNHAGGIVRLTGGRPLWRLTFRPLLGLGLHYHSYS
jgi:hypothetical protein